MSELVKADSLVTLNYRLSNTEDVEFLSTFHAAPTAIQLGNDELAPALERCLIGMAVGERKTFSLPPNEAFGAHQPHMIQDVPRARLPVTQKLEPHTLLEYDGPNGARFTGLILALSDDTVRIDFNHPLAGKTVRFEAEIIGII